jgi:uncharacterized protein YoxC
MSDALLAVAVVAFVVYVVFNVVYLIELKRTSAAVREFIKTTEGSLGPALEEFRTTLGRVRKIADDAGGAVENLRQLTDAVVIMEKGVKKFYEYYKDDLGPAASANIAGLKAGVRTGVVTLLRTLKERKEG